MDGVSLCIVLDLIIQSLKYNAMGAEIHTCAMSGNQIRNTDSAYYNRVGVSRELQEELLDLLN
jgi:hypothetical protein